MMARRRRLELADVQRQEVADHRDRDPSPPVRERNAAMPNTAYGQMAYHDPVCCYASAQFTRVEPVSRVCTMPASKMSVDFGDRTGGAKW